VKIAKKILVPLMASRPVTAVARHFIGYGVPVFMLHRMVHSDANISMTLDHLRHCLQYLVDHDYSFISLEQFVHAQATRQPLPDRSVVFTMDDGYVDQAEIGAPIFLEFGCPLTFFVITGMLDGKLWPWDAQLAWITRNSGKETLETGVTGHTLQLRLDNTASRRHARHRLLDAFREVNAEQVPAMLQQLARDAAVTLPEQTPEDFTPMNWDTARALEQQGIRFAPHSVTHRIMSRVSDDTSAREILNAWETLETELENPLKLFCYPTGRAIDYSRREIRILRDNGFMGAVTTIPGFIDPGSDNEDLLYNLPRFALPDTMEDFMQYCSWIEYAKERFRKPNP
jgi:peptidoglycan/xylan/chitin deacetylase (PgdA/CDA1 family)